MVSVINTVRPTGPVAVLILLLLTAAGAYAQDHDDRLRQDVDTGGLTIECVAGFDGVLLGSGPVPVSFWLSNFTGSDIEGQLVLTDPESKRTVILDNVFLSRDSERTWGTVRALTTWGECYAEFRQGRKLLWRRRVAGFGDAPVNSVAHNILVLNDDGRSVTLPRVGAPKTARLIHELNLGDAAGRSLETHTLPGWQIPVHAAALAEVPALIVVENFPLQQVNAPRMRCLAEWLCQGGQLFLPENATEFLQRLEEAAPLPLQPVRQDGAFGCRTAGMGQILLYQGKLRQNPDGTTAQQIAARAELMSPQNGLSAIHRFFTWSHRSGTAGKNKLMVFMGFGGYTILSGLLVLALSRRSRRVVAVYTITVVLAGSLGAGVLAAILSESRSDVDNLTVTVGTPQGAILLGRHDVTSAGNTNSQLTVRGPQVDVQALEMSVQDASSRRYAYNAALLCSRMVPFDLRRNTLLDEPNRFQTRVALPAWGMRTMSSVAWQPDFPGVEVEISFVRDESSTGQEVPHWHLPETGHGDVAGGEWTVRVKNNLHTDLLNCIILLRTTSALQVSPSFQQQINQWAVPQAVNGTAPAAAGGKTHLVQPLQQTLLLNKVRRDAVTEHTATCNWRLQSHDWNQASRLSGGYGEVYVPLLGRAETVEGWLVARMPTAPPLQVDEGESDFDVNNSSHFFLQRIPPAALPGYEELLISEAARAELEAETSQETNGSSDSEAGAVNGPQTFGGFGIPSAEPLAPDTQETEATDPPDAGNADEDQPASVSVKSDTVEPETGEPASP